METLDGNVQKCWVCGKDATRARYEFGQKDDYAREKILGGKWYRCYCEECFIKEYESEQEERKEYIRLKKREMFRKACNILENQNVNMYRYKEAIDAVEEVVEEKPDKFDSSYEVLAAIILVHNRIYAKMQYKVGPYQVDFLLPDKLVVLEIDGEYHHRLRKAKDMERDDYLKKRLGPAWQVIHVPTSLMDKDARRLPIAIDKVLDYRAIGKVNWRELYK